ncbi:unnamed protein product [Cochlearia groenlandica]
MGKAIVSMIMMMMMIVAVGMIQGGEAKSEIECSIICRPHCTRSSPASECAACRTQCYQSPPSINHYNINDSQENTLHV